MDRLTRSIASTILAGLLLAAVASPAVASPAYGPRRPLLKGTSTNWSGYADETNLTTPANGAVSDVKGTWIVPFVSGTTTAYSAAWVGIDGYSSPSVEQIGTSQDTSKKGTHYYAWFEMYPAPSYTIAGFAVRPGDLISAEVRYVDPNQYVLSINNATTGQSFSTVKTGSANRSSAEWIMEAPSSYSGVLPLANFGQIGFQSDTATINGVTGPISAWPYDAITMISSKRGNVVKAVPSALSSTGDAFSVTWRHN